MSPPGPAPAGRPCPVAPDGARPVARRPGSPLGPTIVVVLAAISLAVLGPGSAGAQEPSVSPVAEASGRLLAPGEGIAPSMVERIDAVVSRVPAIRGLEPRVEVPYRMIDVETFEAELEDLIREEYPGDLLEVEEVVFQRLGLLTPEADLEQLLLGLYADQVLAFYDPRTRAFTLVGASEEIGPLEQVVIAHEYGHALQDQYWDLEGTRIRDHSRSDEKLAHASLAEGDAVAIMYDWAARELSVPDLVAVARSALARQDERLLSRLPPILRRQLESPYLDGFAFVNALRGRGDWDAVDAAWGARPRSTEQILHPELYPDELPVEFELPDLAARLGSGWSTSYEQTLGEMQIGVWLADGRRPRNVLPGLPGPLPRAEAAAGWGGDRLVSLEGPGGVWALVWQTAWDSDSDAREFRRAASAVMKDLSGANSVLEADVVSGLPAPVLVTIADSRTTLGGILSALGLES